MVTNATHLGNGCAIAVFDADMQTIGDCKGLGMYAVCRCDSVDTFFNAICLSAAHSQLIANLNCNIKKQIVVHILPHN